MKFAEINSSISRAVAAFTVVLLFMAPWLYVSAGQGRPVGIADGDGTDTVEVDSATADVAISEPDLLWPLNVQSRLDVLLQGSIFETSTVGMMVYDLTADSVIYRHNERQLMRPASTLKMMVAVAALDRLGGNYRYATRLLRTGDVDGGVLDGDLYCEGGFDPAFGASDLNAFVDSVRRLGVDTIRGNLYADLSMKDADRLGEGWCWDDDNPVLSPLLLSGKDDFMERFRDRLRRAGIEVEGEIRTGRVPGSARELCVVERRIDEVLPRMMKKSDNLYSESLFYHLAASAGSSAPATARQGRHMVNRLIERLGYKPSAYYIADGSGLSPLYASMPIAGIDGTLDNRMRHGYARGNVHAKTGTVTGVSSLAGYCTAANGHVLCFSIINMGIRHTSSGRRFQDKVCEALCRP